jgi:hypothetical protein
MKQNVRNDGKGANRVFSRLAAEKKKSIVALCLIAVMGFMWVRVLLKKTPESAEAAARQDEVKPDTSASNSELKISFIELPKVAGRNDVLTKDFFAVNDWQDFIDGKKEVSVVSRDDDEEIVERVTEKLKLEAIALGKNPQAFINDKLLSVGDKLLVAEGVDTYECEVVGIEEKTVSIRCREAEITLKLTQASITDY